MTTFNGERYLREQVESILAQSPPPDELVIGDDGSTDGTLSLIGQLADQSAVPIRVVGGDHVGLRLNVQRTIEACRGGVIILSDQDDVWLPGKITRCPGSVCGLCGDTMVLGCRDERRVRSAAGRSALGARAPAS